MAKRKKSEDEQSIDQNDSDNNFGLPDIDYKPLDTPDASHTTEETSEQQGTVRETDNYEHRSENQSGQETDSSYSSYLAEEEPRSNAPMVIGLIIALVVVIAGILIYVYVYKPAADKAKQEEIAKENERKRKDTEARLAREREEERRRLEEEEARKPKSGTIETLSSRTKRYYVVISSAVDGDLVMDYAKKLSTKGVSSKIIPPFGKWKFYRLSISDYDTFIAAQTNADKIKAEYGEGVWVIKY
jgi:hypothetical protein